MVVVELQCGVATAPLGSLYFQRLPSRGRRSQKKKIYINKHVSDVLKSVHGAARVEHVFLEG